MEEKGFEAAWIVSPENTRYLTGFAGEGSLFVAKDGCVILTDFRYIEQAARESPGIPVVRTSGDLKVEEALKALIGERSLKTVAIERNLVTLDQYDKLPEGVAYPALGGIPEKLRRVKDEGELSSIRKASAIACRAFEEMLSVIKAGMTEKEVAMELDRRMLRLGSERPAFDTIAAAGVNGSLPHAVPSDHVLADGELLTMDFGAQVNGYKTDMTRTVAIGQISEELRAVYDAVLTAQQMALEAVAGRRGLPRGGQNRQGLPRRALSRRVRAWAGPFGGPFHSRAAAVQREKRRRAGGGQRHDGGTGRVPAGKGGCRIEDSVIVTADGFENLITAPKALIVL
jgi:Xaa-Pro aminopeptidase